jgi:hypothetical protein
MVALPLVLDDGAEPVLLLFVLLLELEDEDDWACSPGADMVRQSAAATKRPKNLW